MSCLGQDYTLLQSVSQKDNKSIVLAILSTPSLRFMEMLVGQRTSCTSARIIWTLADFFVDRIKAHGMARTQNGSGRNRTKGIAEIEGGMLTAGTK